MKSHEHIRFCSVSWSHLTDSISRDMALPEHWFYENKSQ